MIKIEDLSVAFGETEAVRYVNLDLVEGEILGVVGESGSGKSVTALTLMGLAADTARVTTGRILFDGVTLREAGSPCDKRLYRSYQGARMSMVFQEPMTSLNPTQRAGRQVEEMLRLHTGLAAAERREKVLEAFRAVGLREPEKVYASYPHQLSGGMRQRVMIAMALACKPDILIADEPTTALDVTIQAQILRLMNDLQKENGTAIMFITHDLGVINEMADDVVVMYCGQVVEQAPARLIFTDCEKSHPYTEGLMYSIPRLNDERAKLDPIPGVVPHPLDLPQGCKFAPRCRYCTGKCIREEPELLQVAEGQLIRCFYPDKMERRSEKHGKNTVHGQREDH